ncbi:hypothetical protein DFH09DRAFT_1482315 [Mycena vulgaris]|nr:hypothetical protein DFH09DRAFT_1482315 [Mycena vulgaris]
MRLSKYARFAAPSRAPQYGSGSSQRSSERSYIGSASAQPLLSESSDARSVRGVITHDARMARFPRLPYPRTTTLTHAGLVSIGLVVGLDYQNLCVAPYHKFQRMKHHPQFHALLATPGVERVTYAQHSWAPEPPAAPFFRLRFDGTGMLAAFAALHSDTAFVSTALPATFKHAISLASSVSAEFLVLAFDATIEPTSKAADSSAAPAPPPSPAPPRTPCAPIMYPAFEPPLSTELMSGVALTGTNHAEGEAAHLRVMRGVDGPALSAVDTRWTKVNAEGEKGGGDVQETAAGTRRGECGDADGEVEGWEGTEVVVNSPVRFLPLTSF